MRLQYECDQLLKPVVHMTNVFVLSVFLCRKCDIQTRGAPCWQLHPDISEQRSRPTKRSSLQETPLPLPGGAGQEAERNREGQNPHRLNWQPTDWIHTHTEVGLYSSGKHQGDDFTWGQGVRSDWSVSRVKQQDGHLTPHLQRLQICLWIGDLVNVVCALCHTHHQRASNTTLWRNFTWDLKQQFFFFTCLLPQWLKTSCSSVHFPFSLS